MTQLSQAEPEKEDKLLSLLKILQTIDATFLQVFTCNYLRA